MRLLTITVFSALLMAQPEADRLLGVWNTPEGRSQIEIVKCGDAYCGSIKTLNAPAGAERKRVAVGQQILKNFKYASANTWSGGTLYAPERDREVSPKLVLTAPDSLEVRVSVGLARKTVVWSRAR